MSPPRISSAVGMGGFPRVSGDEPMNAMTLGDLD